MSEYLRGFEDGLVSGFRIGVEKERVDKPEYQSYAKPMVIKCPKCFLEWNLGGALPVEIKCQCGNEFEYDGFRVSSKVKK